MKYLVNLWIAMLLFFGGLAAPYFLHATSISSYSSFSAFSETNEHNTFSETIASDFDVQEVWLDENEDDDTHHDAGAALAPLLLHVSHYAVIGETQFHPLLHVNWVRGKLFLLYHEWKVAC